MAYLPDLDKPHVFTPASIFNHLACVCGRTASDSLHSVTVSTRFGLPTAEREQELLALRTEVATLTGLLKGLRARTDKQAAHITGLERKIKDLEARNSELDKEVIDLMGMSYGGTTGE